MQYQIKKRFRGLAACCLAAFVLSFAFVADNNIALASGKVSLKGQKALKKGDYVGAEKIFRELLGKDARDTEARLGLSFALLKQRNLQGAYDNAARVIMSY